MAMPLSAHQKALQIQKRIFNSLKAEISIILGKTPATILKYEKETRKDFNVNLKQVTAITKTELISTVIGTDVSFIADFHTFDQAQRTALRIIRESIQVAENTQLEANEKKIEWMIGLELISSEFQQSLDDFQDEKLSTEEFHEIISYREEWGFPWTHYVPIFDWAKQNRIRLIALNRTQKKGLPLSYRDRWAAKVITQFFRKSLKQGHRPKMIVLYGELHVGTWHLPAQLSRISKKALTHPLTSIAIHQNEARLFWKLADHCKELQTEVMRIDQNIFCVFSSTPWAKLQSLISWLEGDSHDSTESEHDYLSMLHTYGTTITEFLGEPHASYEAITACTADQTEILEPLIQNKQFTSHERRLIQFHVNHNQRLYIPRVSIAYLGTPSHNGAAELAAIHLLRMRNQSEQIFSHEMDDFYRLILESTFGFFGSLILNHRRKCDLFIDHQRRLRDLGKNKKPAFPFEREARLITVNILNNTSTRGLDLKTIIPQKKLAPAVMMGAKYLGKIYGTRVHQAVLSETISLSLIQQIFLEKKTSSKTDYEDRYKEMIQAISRVLTSTSKSDRL